MRDYGENIPKSKVVEKILHTMSMKFDHVVTTIIESHDTNTMMVAKLLGIIESHENKILKKTKKANEEDLMTRILVKILIIHKVERIQHAIHRRNCTLIDKNGRFIAKVKMTPDRLFPLKIQHEKYPCLSSIIPNDDWLWHMSFGHFHFLVMSFKLFKVFVEKQSGYKIKALRTNRGQEYLVCANFFEQHGIHHQITTRYTLQHNGVVEMKNRTIMDMVRYVLKAYRLLGEFWAEVVAIVVYILNKCPIKTPKEAWSRRTPSIKHFKAFGCIAYAHVSDQLKKKFDDTGEKYVFISYYTNSKAYKLYNPET
uniref:Retrovirus-related Pol polyprotein from transposon TNT 1-94 n=1 Tax=Cajanus cajan TaxID=3821 RepID=A0A151RSK3_CAJCA|nr:Retrovirus-related Pol polyprotein from transposon TNT 1-94 [Cajanus cajan]